MERKIGEIFEYNGEWYQCIPDTTDDCNNCFFQKSCSDITGYCFPTARSDGKSVAFKKLEKVGEPFYSKFFGKFYQMYKTYIPAVGCNFKIRVTPVEYVGRNEIFIEIKQKEKMEEKKLNLKPFDIQKAREGKPICTRDGRKARIICFDAKGDYPIVALIESGNIEGVQQYMIDGHCTKAMSECYGDLMMLPEKKEGWVNVYKDSVYDTKDQALIGRSEIRGYIDTIKISWEE